MVQSDDYGVPRFLSGDVCKAARIEPATLKNWISRTPSVIPMSAEDRARLGAEHDGEERPAGGSGRTHLFTYRRVMQIAITAELVALDFAPRNAGVAAIAFTDVSSDVEKDKDGNSWLRYPGEVFRDGRTLLVAHSGTDGARVVKITDKTTVLELLHMPRSGRKRALVIVDINAVEAYVRSALGLDTNWGRTWLKGGPL